MPIHTSPIKLTVNCAKHGDNFYHLDAPKETEPCKACAFLLHYQQKMALLVRETESLNAALEGFLKSNEIVPCTLSGKFMTVAG